MSDDAGQLALWQLPSRHDSDTPLVKATKATLAQLEAADRLPPERASLAQLCIALAESIDGGAQRGRASAVAMAAAQLRETMLVLDPPADDSDASGDSQRLLRELMVRLDAAADTTLRAVE